MPASPRGLYLVDTLTDRWGVEDAPGTRVWLEMSPGNRRAA